jgi:hypothetical protein
MVRYYTLFDFFVKRDLFHNRIVLFKFDPFCGILPVFRSDVAAHTWQAAGFMFGALEYYLNSIPFLCHFLICYGLRLCLTYAAVKWPLALASFKTAEIPTLLMVFIAFVVNFSVIQRSSSGMKKRFV